MDHGAPMMLPKGIVTNTSNVYNEVANYPTVPPDKVWQYWRVYTITNKNLKDPTARRLENFWWHVWGSDRRFLSGPALARLYEHISLGPTIAPLQGPPNRWEGPDAPYLTRQLILAHLSQEPNAPQHPPASPPPAKRPSLSFSASKPPPSHPILKKSRGPSASGPRPTARFVSPHESADEGDDDGQFLSSASNAAATALELPLTAARKKPPAATKKFVAASAAARRRPLPLRRSSSQSPISSALTARDADPPTTAATLARTFSPIPEQRISTPPLAHEPRRAPADNSSRGNSSRGNSSRGNSSRENSSRENSSRENSSRAPAPSAKALGKRPLVPPKTVAANDENSRPPYPSASVAAGPTNNISAAAAALAAPLSSNDTPPNKTSPRASKPGSSPINMAPAMARSQSHNGSSLHSDRIRNPTPSQGLFTGATASTTNVAARGTIIDQSGSLPAPSMLDAPPTDNAMPTRSLASSLLESRLAPTQPGPSTSVPMGRTRSQLTLLLEREKARVGDKPRPKSQRETWDI